jgi:hypothetical protein
MRLSGRSCRCWNQQFLKISVPALPFVVVVSDTPPPAPPPPLILPLPPDWLPNMALNSASDSFTSTHWLSVSVHLYAMPLAILRTAFGANLILTGGGPGSVYTHSERNQWWSQDVRDAFRNSRAALALPPKEHEYSVLLTIHVSPKYRSSPSILPQKYCPAVNMWLDRFFFLHYGINKIPFENKYLTY